MVEIDDVERWLTQETAERESQQVIDQVFDHFRDRDSNPYSESTAWQQAALHLQRDWFSVSIGLTYAKERTPYTVFLSDAKGVGNLYLGPILPFTNWQGSLLAKLREAAQKGTYPRQLAYGPPGRELDRPVGPLVEYRIANSRIREWAYHSADAPAPAAAEPEGVAEPALARRSLRPIWLTIDPEQDSNFRWPFHGIYVLSGGPGTGKTSVALLRIRFLVEQQRNEDMEALLPEGLRPLQKDFFTEEDMLVVVWEPHLQPYLKESLVESRFADVPVSFYENWLNDRLRTLVPIGDYRIEDGVASLETLKRQFTEKQLGEWIKTWDASARGLPHPLAETAYTRILEFIERVRRTHRLAAAPDRVVERWEVFPTPVDRARFRYNQAGLDAACARVRGILDALESNCKKPAPIRQGQAAVTSPRPGDASETPAERQRRREQVLAAIPALRNQLEQLRLELQASFQNRYPQLLLAFYAWVSSSFIPAARRDEFIQKAGEKIEGKRLSKNDRVLILWLVQLMAERAHREGADPDGTLPDYSHVMVDEAQQYDALVLRLFCRLARPPFNSVTLVGDLRQRLREDGGVVLWDDLDLVIPEERRARLLVNYRWAEATFAALHRLADVLEMRDVELKQPLRWPAGPGLPAIRLTLTSPDEEIEHIVDGINTLRLRSGAERWSIAVLLPDEYATQLKKLIARLGEVAINASWTVGENVRAGREGVTITDARSVVGLEFDAVFIAGAQHLLPSSASEVQRQTFWVMATRARQHLCVTSSGPVMLLTRWVACS